MVSLISAVLAGFVTYFVYVLAWATTLIPLAIVFIVAWFIFWLLIRLGKGDPIEEVFDAFFIVFLIKAINGDD